MNLPKPLLSAVCNPKESRIFCKAKELALNPAKLHKDYRGGSQLLGAQVIREDLVFELQPESWEERVTELANILDCPDFRIWGKGRK